MPSGELSPRAGWGPAGLPTEVPHPLRMWDHLLGGKDNFQVDRSAVELAVKYVPNVVVAARAVEAFVIRAGTWITRPEHGLDQFLHYGCCLPRLNSPSLSGLAHARRPGSRFVFVTDDRVGAAYARAVLPAWAGAGQAHTLWADFRDPAPILASRWLHSRLDLSRPVGLLLIGMLDFISDDKQLAEVLTELKAALAPGSLVVMAHLLEDRDASVMVQALKQALANSCFQYTPRPFEVVRHLVAHFDFVDPGFVRCTSWRPDGQGPGQDLEERCTVAGGVAIIR